MFPWFPIDVGFVILLYYLDHMRYILAAPEDPLPQLLQVWHGGRLHRMEVHHLELERKLPASMWWPPHPHAHDVYHVVLYLGGDNRFLLGDERPACRRGALALVSPGITHSFGAVDRGGVCYQEIMFSLQTSNSKSLRLPFHELLSIYAGTPLPRVEFPVMLDERQIQIHNGLLVELLSALNNHSPSARITRAAALLRLFLFFIEAVYHPNMARSPQTKAPGLLRAREMMDRDFHRKLRLSDLSKAAGMSPEHFCRKFKAAFGLAPIQYLLRMRVQSAKILLQHTSLSCKEIAAQNGFSDPIFFNRIFKREAGMTPGACRRGF
ncbi:MAG: AraC family transcriptional regulator [Verrucomicrobiae bacterium]|nr:AraC family transcriptional regulator [Verrucomicrobiae bacterium]